MPVSVINSLLFKTKLEVTSMINLVLQSKVRQREKKFSKLSLVKVNPEIRKLRKEQKLKSQFEIPEKNDLLNLMAVLKMCPPSMQWAT